MCCEGKNQNLTVEQREQRERQREVALRELERELLAGRAKLVMQGDKPTFEGWNGGDGWMDACAFRRLSSEGSSALRQAQARSQPDRMQRQVTQ